MSIIYRYYKQYRYFSHIRATRLGGRLDEPEVPLGGVAAGGVVVPKYLWCGPTPDGVHNLSRLKLG